MNDLSYDPFKFLDPLNRDIFFAERKFSQRHVFKGNDHL